MAAIEQQQEVVPQVEVPDIAAEADKKKKLSLKKNVKPTDHGGPSHAKTSYMIYCDDVRLEATKSAREDCEKSGEKMAVTHVMKKTASMWKECSQETKNAYIAKAAEVKAKHDADMENWKLSKDYKIFLKASASHKKKQDDKKNIVEAKESGMPKKPMAGYMFFGSDCSKLNRTEIEAKGEKYTVMASARLTKDKWDALGEEAQQKYKDTAAAAKAQYVKDLAAWMETEAGKKFAEVKGANVEKRNSRQKVKRVKKEKVGEKRQRSQKVGGRKAKRVKKDGTATGEVEAEDEDLLSSPEESGEDEEEAAAQEEAQEEAQEIAPEAAQEVVPN